METEGCLHSNSTSGMTTWGRSQSVPDINGGNANSGPGEYVCRSDAEMGRYASRTDVLASYANVRLRTSDTGRQDDRRSEFEIVDASFAGELNPFTKAYLKVQRKKSAAAIVHSDKRKKKMIQLATNQRKLKIQSLASGWQLVSVVTISHRVVYMLLRCVLCLVESMLL